MTTARVRPVGGLPLAGQLDGSEILIGSQQGAAVGVTAQKLAAKAASLVPPQDPATKASVGLGNVDNLSAADIRTIRGLAFDSVEMPALRSQSERVSGFRVSLLEWVTSQSERAAILAGTSSTDHTALVRTAVSYTAARGLHLLVEGRYNLSDEVTGFAPGQTMHGRSWLNDGFRVMRTFNRSARSVINLIDYACLENLRISYPDPYTYAARPLTRSELGTNVAGLVDDRFREVPAINCPYTLIDLTNILIENSNYGIRAVGNAGGSVWWNLRICGFKKGVQADGLKDFLKGGAWEFWPYGLSVNGAESWYYDGSTIGADLGDVESLALSDVLLFGANLVIREPRDGQVGTMFGYISSVSLDGNSSRIVISDGRLQIGTLYSTKDSGQSGYSGRSATCFKTLTQTGGQLIIGNADIKVNGGANDIDLNGGYLEIQGGRHVQVNGGFRSGFITGGRAKITLHQEANSVAVPRSIEFWACLADGVADLQNLTFEAVRAGESGNAVVFANDKVGSSVPRVTGGWGVALTAGSAKIQCSPCDAAKFGFQPTIGFVNQNGFVPVYTTQYGAFWHTDHGVEFSIRLVVNMNNVAVASGDVIIGNLPSLSGDNDGKPFSLGAWKGIAFDSPFLQMSAVYDANRNAIALIESGSASGAAPQYKRLVATNFVSNVVAEINVSGFISKR